MFEIGDYIIYGSNGVCKVDQIGTMDANTFVSDRLFYTLIPVYRKESKVFTPVDNDKVIMRHIITKKEAMELIGDIDNIETIKESNDKKREEVYRTIVRQCDCREWVRMIKTLYKNKNERLAGGKKVTAGEEKYLKIAEDSLFGELAIPLEIQKNKVDAYIRERANIEKY